MSIVTVLTVLIFRFAAALFCVLAAVSVIRRIWNVLKEEN